MLPNTDTAEPNNAEMWTFHGQRTISVIRRKSRHLDSVMETHPRIVEFAPPRSFHLPASASMVARRRQMQPGVNSAVGFVMDNRSVLYQVHEFRGSDAVLAIRLAEKEMKLQDVHLKVVQQIGSDLCKDSRDNTRLRALLLVAEKSFESSVRGVAESSAALCITLGSDVRMLYVRPKMRRRGIATAIAQFVVNALSTGETIFINAPACLTGAARDVWKAVGFQDSSHAAGIHVHPTNAKGTPSRMVASMLMSFTKITQGVPPVRSLRQRLR